MFLRLSAPGASAWPLLGPTGPLGHEEDAHETLALHFTVPGAWNMEMFPAEPACQWGCPTGSRRQLREPTGHIIKNLPLLHLADGNSVVTAQQTAHCCTEGCRPPAPAPGALSLRCPLPEAKRGGQPYPAAGLSLDPTPGILCVALYLPHRLALPCPAHPMFLLPVWASGQRQGARPAKQGAGARPGLTEPRTRGWATGPQRTPGSLRTQTEPPGATAPRAGARGTDAAEHQEFSHVTFSWAGLRTSHSDCVPNSDA